MTTEQRVARTVEAGARKRVDYCTEGRRPHASNMLECSLLPFILALLMAYSSLITLVGLSFEFVGLSPRIGVFAVHSMLALAIVLATPFIARLAPHRVWVCVIFFISLFFIGVLAGTGSGEYYVTLGSQLISGMFWMIAVTAIRDFKRCRRYLYFAAIVIFATACLRMVVVPSGEDGGLTYSQYTAYSILPAVLIFVDAAFEKRHLTNVLLAAASLLLLISAGARGPFIVVLIFVLMRFAFEARRSSRTAIITGGLTVLATFSILRYYESIVAAVVHWLEKLTLSTRVITRLLDGNLLEDEARGALRNYTLDLVRENPTFGVGLGNERFHLAESMRKPASEALGWYPHNIILEVLAQFGVAIGILCILVLIVAIVAAIRNRADPDRCALVLLFVGLGLLPLAFSASYIGWPPFFALVGLCIAASERKYGRSLEGEIRK